MNLTSLLFGVMIAVTAGGMLFSAFCIGYHTAMIAVSTRVFRPWLDRKQAALDIASARFKETGQFSTREIDKLNHNYADAWASFEAVQSPVEHVAKSLRFRATVEGARDVG